MRHVLRETLFPMAVLAGTALLFLAVLAMAAHAAVLTEPPLLLAGLAAGSIVRVDLPSLYIDARGQVYRPGDGVPMPADVARDFGLVPRGGWIGAEAPEDVLGDSGIFIGQLVGSGSPDSGEGTPVTDEDGFPEGFPGLHALRGAGFTLEDVREATREDLIAIDGIGEKTADAILAAVKES